MALDRVWLQTLGDGLVGAGPITGIEGHPTPAVAGEPGDGVLGVPSGSGHREGWTVTALHRTVIQTGQDPSPAAPALARLLAQLDVINAAGIITASLVTDRGAHGEGAAKADDGTAVAGGVRLRFAPFAEPAPGR